jgi:hypothetical protein
MLVWILRWYLESVCLKISPGSRFLFFGPIQQNKHVRSDKDEVVKI